MKKNNFIVVITGPIASGKDEVSAVLKKLGANVIDADVIGHKILEKGKKAYTKIVKAFGPSILNKNKQIDRAKLAAKVFSDRSMLNKLNSISHPEIKACINKETKSFSGILVVNAALLKELDLSKVADLVVTVYSAKQKRLARLVGRKYSKKEALHRMSSQMGDDRYRELSDIILKNDGSLKELRKAAKKLFEIIRVISS